MWNVLVVDDDFISRKLIIEILKGKAECDAAANGQEAIQAYNLSIVKSKPYDLVILDISMPGVDGIKVLRLIRQTENKKGISERDEVPIIIVTAHKAPLNEAMDAGCNEYLLKPIRAAELLEKIQQALQRKR